MKDESERKLKVFLCHASQDKPIVHQLYQRLTDEGWIEPWLDAKKLLPGQDWQAEITNAVETADNVIIFLSNTSINKNGFVQKELRLAKDVSLLKSEGSIFLIPLRLDDCDVPKKLQLYQWANYFGQEKEQSYEDLLVSLKLHYEEILRKESLFSRIDEEEKTSKDQSLSSLHLDEIYTNLLQACSVQVEAEIASMVGKKFIPELYVNRDAQEKIDLLLRPERHVTDFPLELKQQDIGDHSRNQAMPREFLTDLIGSVNEDKSDFLFKTNGKMYMLTARAGTGKTNLLCHLALQYRNDQPTIFLTSRSGITERTSITELIEIKVGKFLGYSITSGLFDTLVHTTEIEGKKLVVLIDALNEHRDIELLNAAISEFLFAIKGKPVIVLATCRDIYWDFFESTAWPQDQWSKLDLNFGKFSRSETSKAIVAYFNHYKISVELSERAESNLAHPLILRFFCETYGNPQKDGVINLPSIKDLRLKALFDEYISHKLESIRFTSPKRRRNSKELEDFLFSLAIEMRRNKSSEVPFDELSRVTNHTDLDSPDSPYVAILGEDILLEEKPSDNTRKIQIRFTFEEFMEYMIARSMIIEKLPLSYAKAKTLVAETFQISSLSNFVGIFEYLFTMLREDYDISVWDDLDVFPKEMKEAIVRAISKMNPALIGESELRMLENLLSLQTGISDVTLMGKSQRNAGIRNAIEDCLFQILSESGCTEYVQKRIFEIIRKLLTFAETSEFRYGICKHFENEEIISMSNEANRIAEWWKKHKKEIWQKPILISDNDRDVLDLVVFSLKFAGFSQVYREPSALHAIETAKRIKPSLIITDWKMSDFDMDGIERARVIKEDPTLFNTKIFMVTVRGLESEIQMLSETSLFSDHMSKPFAPDQFVEKVYALLTGRMDDESGVS